MSRVAKAPVNLPSNVEVNFKDDIFNVKGPLGSLALDIHELVALEINDNKVIVKPKKNEQKAWALAGTMRALINNNVEGVTNGFVKSLELIGVGYRVQAKGKVLNLSLGYSHPIDYELPEGVTAEIPSNTKLVLKSSNKQILGQTAAEIRALRPPEPYKGKGIRYENEVVLRKETKKK